MSVVTKPEQKLYPQLLQKVKEFAETATKEGTASYNTVLPAIFKLFPAYPKNKNVPSLLEAIKRFDEANGACAFATTILPSMAESAAQFHTLMPDPISVLDSKKGQRQVQVAFTKRQCHCILSNAFLCTFPRVSDDCFSHDGSRLPSINYDEMHCAPFRGAGYPEVEVAKELMTLDYFAEMADRISYNSPSMDDPDDSLVIVRSTCEDGIPEGAFANKLCPVTMHGLGESIDLQKDMVRVDFANCVIGGASLSFGCVQEEIMFSICPEMNVSRMLCPPMERTEAIILLRAEQFSEVKEGTYAFSLQHGKRHAHPNPRSSVVTCIDAMDYRSVPRKMQYKSNVMERELLKAVAGFDVQPIAGVIDSVPKELATGNWGCGAFLGDARLKILIQWIACSLCGKDMHYFPFDQKELLYFAPIADALVTKGVLAADVYTWLMSGGITPGDVFGQVVAKYDLELNPMA